MADMQFDLLIQILTYTVSPQGSISEPLFNKTFRPRITQNITRPSSATYLEYTLYEPTFI